MFFISGEKKVRGGGELSRGECVFVCVNGVRADNKSTNERLFPRGLSKHHETIQPICNRREPDIADRCLCRNYVADMGAGQDESGRGGERMSPLAAGLKAAELTDAQKDSVKELGKKFRDERKEIAKPDMGATPGEKGKPDAETRKKRAELDAKELTETKALLTAEQLPKFEAAYNAAKSETANAGLIGQMTEKLALTDEQKTKLTPIMKEAGDKMATLRADETLTRRDKAAQNADDIERHEGENPSVAHCRPAKDAGRNDGFARRGQTCRWRQKSEAIARVETRLGHTHGHTRKIAYALFLFCPLPYSVADEEVGAPGAIVFFGGLGGEDTQADTTQGAVVGG